MVELSASFDKVADEYNRYRDGYDPKVIADIKSITGLGKESALCEIGAGTGQASVDFVLEVSKLVCVEPGSHLAERLRSNLARYDNVEVLNTTFEDAALPLETFQVVIAAQSFHWVNPTARYKKTFEVLKPGGWLCAFWKRWLPSGNECTLSEFQLFKEYFPDYVIPKPQEHEAGALMDLSELVESALFSRCQLRRYPSSRVRDVRSPDEQAESLRTWSKIAALEKDKQDEIIRRLKEIYRNQSTAMSNGETVVVFGQKRG